MQRCVGTRVPAHTQKHLDRRRMFHRYWINRSPQTWWSFGLGSVLAEVNRESAPAPGARAARPGQEAALPRYPLGPPKGPTGEEEAGFPGSRAQAQATEHGPYFSVRDSRKTSCSWASSSWSRSSCSSSSLADSSMASCRSVSKFRASSRAPGRRPLELVSRLS